MTKSAYSRTAIGVILRVSIGSAKSMTSPMMELIGPMPTCSTPWGSCSRAADKRSPTIWRARKMSVFQLNVTYTNDSPTLEIERTLSTPGMPLIAVSSGTVINCSTSSGAMPPASA